MIVAVIVAGAVVALTPVVHGGDVSFPSILSRLVAESGWRFPPGCICGARRLHPRAARPAERLERERELLSDQAVTEERVRIARDSTTSSPTTFR